MKKIDRYTSLIWAVFGFYIAIEGYRLQVGTFRVPKSGFLIFWSGIILGGLSLILFLQTFFLKEGEEGTLWKGRQWKKGFKLMVALFIYALVLKSIGFILGTFFLLLFLFKGLEPQKWRTALLLSVIVTGFSYLLFEVFLEFNFPGGILAKILP